MLLPDVNVLVYAHRRDAPDHARYLAWLESEVNSDQAYGLADLVLSGFIRVVTHPRVFNPVSSLDDALAFVNVLRARDNCVPVLPGPRHWDLFCTLCRRAGAKGNVVPDAYLAALAIESGSEWVTTDRGFARFPGLRWRHPLNV
jgi:toxin-antitoxin system PIN domain toxin